MTLLEIDVRDIGLVGTRGSVTIQPRTWEHLLPEHVLVTRQVLTLELEDGKASEDLPSGVYLWVRVYPQRLRPGVISFGDGVWERLVVLPELPERRGGPQVAPSDLQVVDHRQGARP